MDSRFLGNDIKETGMIEYISPSPYPLPSRERKMDIDRWACPRENGGRLSSMKKDPNGKRYFNRKICI